MPIIRLVTEINAPLERCFNLARSVDLHKLSTGGTREEAVAGITSGLIGMGEEVTWEATHFWIRQRLSSRITAYQYPVSFRDEMIEGTFKKIKHDHRFEEVNGRVYMNDRFEFKSPMGLLGELVNVLLLTPYLRRLLEKRNKMIKATAEGEQWKIILKQDLN